MTDRPGLEFSFSGLKTRAMLALEGVTDRQGQADVAHAFEEAIVDTLTIKCERALEQSGLQNIVVAGGVGANLRLRESLANMAQKRGGGAFFPRHEFCTDNAAMIAYAGWLRLRAGQGRGGRVCRARALAT